MPRVLVLEDSLLSRQILKKILKPAGYDVVEAPNGTDGLEILASQPVDCVLLDLGMPGLSGEDVLAILKQRQARLPVIVISADIQETTRKRCLDLGAFAVLHKIVEPQELLQSLESALRSPLAEAQDYGLTAAHLDALQELLNIGLGRAAAMLNRMLKFHVNLQIPSIQVCPGMEIQQQLEQSLGLEQIASVQLTFKGTFNGMVHLIFPPASAAKLVAALMGESTEPPEDLDAMTTGTLTEVGNVVLNGVMGKISNVLQQQLSYSIPTYTEVPIHCLFPPAIASQNSSVILAETRFSIEQILVVGEIILIFNVRSFNILLSAIEAILEVSHEERSSP